MEKPLRPTGAAIKLRSCIKATTMAVDDSAKAKAPMRLACQVQPTNKPTGKSAAAQATICSVPPPNTAPRISHSRLGSSSRPMTNSISTTPNSETCSKACGSLTKPKPTGPITTPATK